MKNKKIYYIASILSIFILVLNFFNAKSLHENLSKQEVLNTSSARVSDGPFLKLRENEIVFDNTFINSITRKKVNGTSPYRLGLNMVRAGNPYSGHEFVYADIKNLSAKGVRQVQGHDLNWSVIWEGYGAGVGEKSAGGNCINVPKGCTGSNCWYIEPSSSSVKEKEGAFVPGNFSGNDEDFSLLENYNFSDAEKFLSQTSFYFQPTLFVTGPAQNRLHFICLDENDENNGYTEEDYCHENGVKGSDIEQCQWLYTPNGHKITLDSGDDYFDETKEAIKGYLENVAIKSAGNGIRHFEVGNELERFPHPSVLGIYNWKKIDRYYMRLLKLSKSTLVNKYQELGEDQSPITIFSGLFSTDYNVDREWEISQPHNLDFLQKVLREIKDDMDDSDKTINEYFDIFNFHHYQGWKNLRPHINNLKNIFKEEVGDNFDDDISFWATEIGLTNHDFTTGPFELNESSLGRISFSCSGHGVQFDAGINENNLSDQSKEEAKNKCRDQFISNTVKESRNMLKYMAIAWGNGVELINWHTHLQNSEFYHGLRMKYTNATSGLDGCLNNSNDPTLSSFSNYSQHKNYCAKTSWYAFRLIAEKLGNFGRAKEVHYNKDGLFLYKFSHQNYDYGEGVPQFVTWFGCLEDNCEASSGSLSGSDLLNELTVKQQSKFNGCLQITSLRASCKQSELAFCSKFPTNKYYFNRDGSDVDITADGYPKIISPCE